MSKLCEERLAICKNCVLCRKSFDGGIRCDSSKYANADGTKSSYLPKAGYKRGCGCLMSVACANESKHCVLGKW